MPTVLTFAAAVALLLAAPSADATITAASAPGHTRLVARGQPPVMGEWLALGGDNGRTGYRRMSTPPRPSPVPVWEFRRKQFSSEAEPCMALFENRLYTTELGAIHAREANTGNVTAVARIPAPLGGRFSGPSVHPPTRTLLVTAYCGSLLAFDVDTMRHKWTAFACSDERSKTTVANFGVVSRGNVLYTPIAGGVLAAVDAASGRVLTQQPVQELRDGALPRWAATVTDSGVAWSNEGLPQPLGIVDPTTLTERWTKGSFKPDPEREAPQQQSLGGGYVTYDRWSGNVVSLPYRGYRGVGYVISNTVARRADSGAPAWPWFPGNYGDTAAYTNVHSVAVGPQGCYWQTRNQNLFCTNATSGDVVISHQCINDIDGPCTGTPVVTDTHVFIPRTFGNRYGRMLRLEIATGKTELFGGDGAGSLALGDGWLFQVSGVGVQAWRV